MAWLEFTNFKNIFCINSAVVSIRVSKNSISGIDTNDIEKLKASYHFYSDLIINYFNSFSWKQRVLIIRIYESKIFKTKGKSFKNFSTIAYLYLKNMYVLSLFRFTFRYLLMINNE